MFNTSKILRNFSNLTLSLSPSNHFRGEMEKFPTSCFMQAGMFIWIEVSTNVINGRRSTSLTSFGLGSSKPRFHDNDFVGREHLFCTCHGCFKKD